MDDVVKTLLEERYLLAAFMGVILAMLVTGRGLATSSRLLEWKERAERYESEKGASEEALRANNTVLERMADALSEQNRINEIRLEERQRNRQT